MKTFLGPHRRLALEKKKPCIRPFKIPNAAKILPIVDGGSPRPPRAIGVEKKTGWMERKAMSTKESEA